MVLSCRPKTLVVFSDPDIVPQSHRISRSWNSVKSSEASGCSVHPKFEDLLFLGSSHEVAVQHLKAPSPQDPAFISVLPSSPTEPL